MFSSIVHSIGPASQELPAAPEVLPTGLGELDLLLPHGGFPRGRLSEISGWLGSGKRSVALTLCSRTLADGQPAVWIDAAGGFYPLPALEAGAPLHRLVVVRLAQVGGVLDAPGTDRKGRGRPRRRRSGVPALKAADILLQGGGAVALVVIDVPPDLRIPERQLGRLRLDAASAGASVVFVTERSPHGASLGTFVCLHLGVQHSCRSQLRIEVTKSKLGNMGHRSAVTFEDLHSVRVESTL